MPAGWLSLTWRPGTEIVLGLNDVQEIVLRCVPKHDTLQVKIMINAPRDIPISRREVSISPFGKKGERCQQKPKSNNQPTALLSAESEESESGKLPANSLPELPLP